MPEFLTIDPEIHTTLCFEILSINGGTARVASAPPQGPEPSKSGLVIIGTKGSKG